MGREGLGDFPGGGVEGPGPGHGRVAGPVPVGPVSGHLQGELRHRGLWQLPGGYGPLYGGQHRPPQLLPRCFYKLRHLLSFLSFFYIYYAFL